VISAILMRNSCPVCHANFSVPAQTAFESQFSCSDFEEVDGLRFSINTHSAMEIGFEFEIRGFDDNAKSWRLFGTSSIRKVPNGLRFLPQKSVSVSDVLDIDFRPSWPLVIDGSVMRILYGSMLISISLLGLTGRVELTKTWMTSIFLILCFHRAVIPPGYVLIGEPRGAFVPLVKLIMECAFFAGLLGPQRRLPPAMVVYGSLRLLAKALYDCWLYDDAFFFIEDPDVLSILFILGGVLVMVLSRSAVRRSVLLVESDRHDYDAAWRPFCDTPIKRRRVAALHDAVVALARRCPRGASRQMEGRAGPSAASFRRVQSASVDLSSQLHPCRIATLPAVLRVGGGPVGTGAATESLPGRGGARTLPWANELPPALFTEAHQRPSLLRRFRLAFRPDLSRGPQHASALRDSGVGGRPVRCLGQLYSQATAAAGRLHALAAKWAQDAGGELHMGGEDGGPDLLGWVRAGAVKSPQRAAAKALLCYGGDVSQLTDICRARILLGDPQGMAACLTAIEADGTVRVVRAASSLSPSSSSRPTAGFRVRPRLG
jgi:hypothetical protein